MMACAIRSATKADKGTCWPPPRSMKVIGRAGIGVDNIDIPAATAAGIVVMNTPFGNSITTAEHAIAMMFALARQLPQADQSTQAGKWEKNRFMGVELSAKTLGLIGAGNIGSIVADRANGLKMKVVAYDPFLSPERAVEIGVEKVELDQLLARADIITLHTPLTDKTRNILGAEASGQGQERCPDHQLRPRRHLWTNRLCARAWTQGPYRRRGLRRLRHRAVAEGKPAVRRPQLHRHPAPGAPPRTRRRRMSALQVAEQTG